ncbi:M48 family metallopeptidase [Alcanivorax sp. DP30]|uniref:M48 family metallopeptidase n=1 Tax=Alcanivorax sp. DP30 TaxID=2606217 RepID=UPI0013692084|nr:M48 family metallopeptidase [Alcanivorax sp. DP30]
MLNSEGNTVDLMSGHGFEGVQSYRFSRELRIPDLVSGTAPRTLLDAFKEGYYRNALLISEHVTPGVEDVIRHVLSVFSISRANVEAFVFSDPVIQAACLGSGSDSAAICVSSGAVESLEADELAFVLGHEVGHFILNHTKQYSEAIQRSPEFFECRRYQEISADRYGLVAAGSVDSAMRAIIKTASGLSSRHLQFSVQRFAQQFSKSTSRYSDATYTTHPDMPTRARALLRFDPIKNDPGLASKLQEVDIKIGKDLDKISNHHFIAIKKDLRSRVITWSVLERLSESGRVTPGMKMAFREAAGGRNLDRVLKLLQSESPEYMLSLAGPKKSECQSEVLSMLPFSAADFMAAAEKDVDAILDQ